VNNRPAGAEYYRKRSCVCVTARVELTLYRLRGVRIYKYLARRSLFESYTKARARLLYTLRGHRERTISSPKCRLYGWTVDTFMVRRRSDVVYSPFLISRPPGNVEMFTRRNISKNFPRILFYYASSGRFTFRIETDLRTIPRHTHTHTDGRTNGRTPVEIHTRTESCGVRRRNRKTRHFFSILFLPTRLRNTYA